MHGLVSVDESGLRAGFAGDAYDRPDADERE
jgi:hypothetical protein